MKKEKINKYHLSFGLLLILFNLIILEGCSDEKNQGIKNSFKEIPLFETTKINTSEMVFTHFQKLTQDFEIQEALGSGLAVIDIDNDGIYEVFFAQYNKNNSSSLMYRISGGEYLNITKEVGLDELINIMGVAVGDINNDGWQDMLIYGFKKIYLMVNYNGIFKKFELPKLENNSFYTSATFFKANNDNYLDIWLSRYVDTKIKQICKGNDGQRMYCSPAAYSFQADILLLNNNGLSFEIAPESLINIPVAPSLGVVAADFNNDKKQDIFVANDGQNNHLFIQQNNGAFVNHAGIKNLATNLEGLKEASMGIAVGDYDNNGLTDLYLTHLEQETNTLYKNENEWFTDVTNHTGLGNKSRNQTGFGTGFYDLNGDNWLDLFIVNGRIQPKAYQERKDLTEQFLEKPLLFLNKEGYFQYVEDFKEIELVGRGLVFVDLDNDGDKDMISNNNNQEPTIFINNTNPKSWYGVIVNCNNRIDIGAKIIYTINKSGDAQTYYKTIHADGSYASSNDPRVILYLDNKSNASSVTIEFTNDTIKKVRTDLIANQYNTVFCDNK